MRRILLVWACLGGCDAEDTFTVGREEQVCEANLPTACGLSARCVLDDEHYLSGSFPSARRFIVRTQGEADLQFSLLFGDRRDAGTELQLVVYEPACTDRYVWDNDGRDLFRLADTDGELTIPVHVSKAGDHVVEIVSDAYCSYLLEVAL